MNLNWWPEGSVVRIDDISIQTDPIRLSKFLGTLKSQYPKTQILLAVSVGVVGVPEISDSERVFPPILNAMSDHRNYFKLSRLGIPDWLPEMIKEFDCLIGSHGLVHVDHRLLNIEAQTLSILTSTSALGTNVFVPPFNKYNKSTIEICEEHALSLVIWENGWQHLGYQEFKSDGGKYYFHMHDFDDVKLNNIFK